MRFHIVILATILAMLTPASAQDRDIDYGEFDKSTLVTLARNQANKIAELEARVRELEAEVERLKAGEPEESEPQDAAEQTPERERPATYPSVTSVIQAMPAELQPRANQPWTLWKEDVDEWLKANLVGSVIRAEFTVFKLAQTERDAITIGFITQDRTGHQFGDAVVNFRGRARVSGANMDAMIEGGVFTLDILVSESAMQNSDLMPDILLAAESITIVRQAE